jgi:hypothetical protein
MSDDWRRIRLPPTAAHVWFHGGPLDGVLAAIGPLVVSTGWVAIRSHGGHYAPAVDGRNPREHWAWSLGDPMEAMLDGTG